MALQLSPATVYVVGVAAASFVTVVAGAYTLLPSSPLHLAREFVRTDWKYLGVAWTASFLVNQIAKYQVETTFTSTIYAVEGATVSVFQSVIAMPLTVFFSLTYLVGFPFVVLFTYFKLKHHDEEEAYRYTVAYVCIVVLAAPIFVLFPVEVAGHELSGVETLLYDLNPVIETGVEATDTLRKAFPSLHTALSVLAAVYATKTDARYATLAWALAAATVLSTLYLGIHWLTDAATGIVLVGVAYWISQRIDDPQRVFPS